MVKAGLERLGAMQVSDGGWGWFSGYGEHSYAHTTALVVHGLQTADRNGRGPRPGRPRTRHRLAQGVPGRADPPLLKNAPTRTNPYKEKADNLDAFVDMVLVDAGVRNPEMLAFLDRDRVGLSVYAKAMFGLALNARGVKEKLAVVLENIGQFVVKDDENQTAYLKMPDSFGWWYWYGSESEANGYYTEAPGPDRPEAARPPPAGEVPRSTTWTHATYWDSTRDTAVCVEALAEYLKASGESTPEMSVEILVDDKSYKKVTITPADLFTFDNAVVLEGDALAGGRSQ